MINMIEKLAGAIAEEQGDVKRSDRRSALALLVELRRLDRLKEGASDEWREDEFRIRKGDFVEELVRWKEKHK